MRAVVEKQEANTFTEFSVLEEWDDLLLLTGQVNFDHLFVVVSARKGSISYQTSFERLPSQVSKLFCRCQLVNHISRSAGRSAGDCVFLRPAGYNESQHMKGGQMVYKWFKKS